MIFIFKILQLIKTFLDILLDDSIFLNYQFGDKLHKQILEIINLWKLDALWPNKKFNSRTTTTTNPQIHHWEWWPIRFEVEKGHVLSQNRQAVQKKTYFTWSRSDMLGCEGAYPVDAVLEKHTGCITRSLSFFWIEENEGRIHMDFTLQFSLTLSMIKHTSSLQLIKKFGGEHVVLLTIGSYWCWGPFSFFTS